MNGSYRTKLIALDRNYVSVTGALHYHSAGARTVYVLGSVVVYAALESQLPATEFKRMMVHGLTGFVSPYVVTGLGLVAIRLLSHGLSLGTKPYPAIRAVLLPSYAGAIILPLLWESLQAVERGYFQFDQLACDLGGILLAAGLELTTGTKDYPQD